MSSRLPSPRLRPTFSGAFAFLAATRGPRQNQRSMGNRAGARLSARRAGEFNTFRPIIVRCQALTLGNYLEISTRPSRELGRRVSWPCAPPRSVRCLAAPDLAAVPEICADRRMDIGAARAASGIQTSPTPVPRDANDRSKSSRNKARAMTREARARSLARLGNRNGRQHRFLGHAQGAVVISSRSARPHTKASRAGGPRLG